MSRLNGEKLYELMGEIGEDLIAEATPTALLAGTAAVGATVHTAGMYTIPGKASAGAAAKAGFGAWLAKGGWVALAAGAVAAAGIAVGAFFLSSSGDVPPADEDPAIVGSVNERESETESPTDGDTTAEATEEITETPTAEDTAEGTAEPEVLRYFQFPLRTSQDTTSYVSVPDLTKESNGPIEFFVLPSDTDNPELVNAYTLYVSKEFPMNLQLIAFKSEDSYGILYMMEKAQPFPQGGNPNERVIGLDWCCLYFNGTEAGGYYIRDYGYDSSLGSYHFVHTEGEKVSVAAYKSNDAYLRKAEKFISNYSDASRYEYTVLYSYIDGVEIVNTPVEALPEFSFDIFNTYNQPDLGD